MFDSLPDDMTHLYMSISGSLAAVICIDDPIKEEAPSVVARLHEAGFGKVVMMTGDNERTARSIAAAVGIDEYHAEVLPEDKAAFIRSEHEAGRKVIMVGDGVNDTPALSEADVGIAVNSGAAIAREIADITISADDLETLVTLKHQQRADGQSQQQLQIHNRIQFHAYRAGRGRYTAACDVGTDAQCIHDMHRTAQYDRSARVKTT